MDRSGRLSEAHRKLILAQLQPGEFVRWVGRQPAARYWSKRWLRIGFYSLWTVLNGYLAAMMILMNPNFWHKSFNSALPVLAPLVLAVLGIVLLLRELIRLRKGGPDLYAISSRRALVISSGHDPQVWCYPAAALKGLQVRRHKDGSGDIIFEQSVGWSTDAQGRSTRQSRVVGFFGLPCVNEVYDWLEQIERPDKEAFEQFGSRI
jgi:hypothetical protein